MMMRLPSFLLLAVLSVISFSSCRTHKIEPARQAAVPETKDFTVPPSVISVPVSLSVSEVEESINKLYNGLIYQDTSYDDNNGDNMIMKITKTGRFKLVAHNEYWFLDAPISIWVKGRYKTSVLGIGIEEYKDATFNIVVKTCTELSVTEQWDVKAITRGSFDWKEKPYLDLGVIRIPISSFVESTLNKQINEFAKTLDKEIEKFFDLRNNMNIIWQSLYEPVKVSDTYNAWLAVKPYAMMISEPKTSRGNFMFRLGIRSAFDIQVGEKPKATPPSRLPPLLTHQRLDSSFTIYINNLIKYDLVNNEARKELNGKRFDFEESRHHIIIEDIDIFGNGEAFISRVKFKGQTQKGILKKKVEGTLFVRGVPYYDSTDMSIKVKDFNYDVNTSDALLKSANWLLHGALVKQIQKQLVFPVKEQIDQGTRAANDAFRNTPINSISRLNGRIEKMIPYRVFLDAEGIHVVLQCKGVAEVKITGF